MLGFPPPLGRLSLIGNKNRPDSKKLPAWTGWNLQASLFTASYTFAWLVKTIENRPPPRSDPQAEHTVEILAKAHHMLRPPKKKRPAHQPHQLELFD